MTTSNKRVAIIGSGTCGIVALKECLDYNLDAVCYEKRDDIGGLWLVQNPLPQHLNLEARVYQGIVQNVSKHFYCFSDFPPLKEAPYILRSEDSKVYFDAYAQHFDLRKRIRFNREVTKVTKSDDYESTGNWTVTSVDAVTRNDFQTEIYSNVIIATGYFTKAQMPTLPNRECFNGTISHSGLFWNSMPYHDRNVVIVGGGFSAVDLAVILAQNARQVYVITRHGLRVLPLIIEGKSWEFYEFNRAFNTENTDQEKEDLKEKLIARRYDHTKLGLKPTSKYCGLSISNNIDEWIACGKIKIIHGELDHFVKTGVTLKDGQTLSADDVIFATGYDPECSWLDAPDIFPSTRNIVEYPNWLYVLPINQTHTSLFNVGMVFASGSLPPVAELQARLAASIIINDVNLPSKKEMMKWFEDEKKSALEKYNKYPAMTNTYKLQLELAKSIGCYPEVEKISQVNEKLAQLCNNGPLLPAQFRLLGPHANWKLADNVIKNMEGKEDLIVDTV